MAKTSFPGTAERYEFSLTNWQERFVLGILRAASLFGLVSLIAVMFNPATSMALRIVYSVVYLMLLVVTLAPVPYWWRAGFVLFFAYLIGFMDALGGGLVSATRLYFLGAVLLTNLLLSYRASIYAIAITTVTYAFTGYAMLAGYLYPSQETSLVGKVEDWGSSAATFFFLAATVNYAIHLLKSEFERVYQSAHTALSELETSRSALEERVTERTASLEKRASELSAANAVAQSISKSEEIETLLPVTAHAITENYGHYHTGIYLLDEKLQYGYLQAASSEGGKRMLARQQQIALFDEGILQKVVNKQTYQITQNMDADAARLENPDLPDTRARGIFPLRAREHIIGILDIHSTDPNAFQPSEVESLQIIADQLGLAIDNARLFAEMQAIIQQSQADNDARAYLSWRDITKHKTPVYQYTPLAIQKISAAPERRATPGALSVPILLRGRSIGKIHLKRKTGTGWVEQEQAMVREVATQVALALENARLLEDAQTRAIRERSLGEIAARISAAVDVESILRTTAQEIGKALMDSEVTIQLNPESAEA